MLCLGLYSVWLPHDSSRDFLLILVRRLLTQRPDIRVLLMSAAFNIDVFTAYFDDCPRVCAHGPFVPSNTHTALVILFSST